MAKQKKESRVEGSVKEDLANRLKKIQKDYGSFSAGIMSESKWPDVKEWISTGSTWLDSIIKEGVGKGGFPAGRVSLVAGLSGCLTEDTEIEVVLVPLEDENTESPG